MPGELLFLIEVKLGQRIQFNAFSDNNIAENNPV